MGLLCVYCAAQLSHGMWRVCTWWCSMFCLAYVPHTYPGACVLDGVHTLAAKVNYLRSLSELTRFYKSKVSPWPSPPCVVAKFG